MTRKQNQFDRFVARNPHAHVAYFNRPHFSRRDFLSLAGGGLAMSYLAGRQLQGATKRQAGIAPRNTAENVIFIQLTGAISHTDTFDLKFVNGTTPASFAPSKINGIDWPAGLLPKIGEQLSNVAIVRSVKSWALVHSLAQVWSQIGRNPAAALGDIAPNIGSVVAIEKDPLRRPNQVFPTFLALNASGAVGSGYMSTKFEPFRYSTGSGTGIPNTTNTLGQTRFGTMSTRLDQIDGALRKSPQPEFNDYDQFYQSAKGLMYNDAVTKAFSFTAAESLRYGTSSFGNSCLVAKKVLEADQGTRFIQIAFGGWDHHQDIYTADNLLGMGPTLDKGFATLVADLKTAGLLDKTLIVVTGEFGRTVGALTDTDGRDHWPQQSILFAGGGVKGGKVIGSTNATGAETAQSGWSRDRDVRPEDVEATIYSALGIDWTTVRYDDPFGRGFEYVPFASEDLYGPIEELFQ